MQNATNHRAQVTTRVINNLKMSLHSDVNNYLLQMELQPKWLRCSITGDSKMGIGFMKAYSIFRSSRDYV